MNYCIDCKYRWSTFFTCTHPKAAGTPNLLTGEVHYRSCGLMRHREYLCGKEGKLYEPKIPLKNKVVQAIKNKLGK